MSMCSWLSMQLNFQPRCSRMWSFWLPEMRTSRTFLPSQAFGGGIDGHEFGEVEQMLSPESVKAMLGAGLKPLSYRLRTELAIEAWHWNPRGSWSDPAQRRGYWTSDTHSDKPI